MTFNCVKLEHAVTFMKYLASILSLIFLPKALIRNKITFLVSNSLHFAELLVNKLMRVSPKKFTGILVSIRFTADECKDFKSL